MPKLVPGKLGNKNIAIRVIIPVHIDYQWISKNEKRQNYIEAEKWYKKSSEGGNKNGKYNLAYLYETIFKDFEKAKILYLELDDKNSMERIENMERVKWNVDWKYK